jgi:hypothetical protein
VRLVAPAGGKRAQVPHGRMNPNSACSPPNVSTDVIPDKLTMVDQVAAWTSICPRS